MFKNRDLVIATKHGKEIVIAPVLKDSLGVVCHVVENFDTDMLGTFSGDKERLNDPITTARIKCQIAMNMSNYDLSVSSEGSFGPHPTMFFASADDEILLFIDKKNDLEIFARELTTDTNFNALVIKTDEQLNDFALSVKFPSHGLIIRKGKEDLTDMIKGIIDWHTLIKTFEYHINKYGTAYVETDMRAMYNPARMKAIERAAVKLVQQINSCCPNCNTPGFVITERKEGLPCRLCNYKTRSTLSYIYRCKACFHEKEEFYPNKLTEEDPMYCDRCNP